MRFKDFLAEYYKPLNSFSDVVDNKEDEDDKDDSDASESEDNNCEDESATGDKEVLNPTKMRKWMDLSNAGD